MQLIDCQSCSCVGGKSCRKMSWQFRFHAAHPSLRSAPFMRESLLLQCNENHFLRTQELPMRHLEPKNIQRCDTSDRFRTDGKKQATYLSASQHQHHRIFAQKESKATNRINKDAKMKFPTISTLLLGAAAASSSSNAIALAAESSGYCPTIYADFVRRQLANFSPDGIFVAQEGESQKHTPFLTLSDDGKSATVIVGNGEEEGGVYHPMSASTDPLEVHFVTHILVKDQVSTNDILCSLPLLAIWSFGSGSIHCYLILKHYVLHNLLTLSGW